MFTKDSSFSDLVARFQELEACQPGIDWALEEKYQDKTIGEVGEDFKTLSPFTRPFAIWCLEVIFDELDDDCKDICYDAITDPMWAFQLFLNHEKLQLRDERILEDKFRGKLPRQEEKLKNNTLIPVRYTPNPIVIKKSRLWPFN